MWLFKKYVFEFAEQKKRSGSREVVSVVPYTLILMHTFYPFVHIVDNNFFCPMRFFPFWRIRIFAPRSKTIHCPFTKVFVTVKYEF